MSQDSSSSVSITKRLASETSTNSDDESDVESVCSSKRSKQSTTISTRPIVATRISCLKLLLWAFRVQHTEIVQRLVQDWDIDIGNPDQETLPWQSFVSVDPILIDKNKQPPPSLADIMAVVEEKKFKECGPGYLCLPGDMEYPFQQYPLPHSTLSCPPSFTLDPQDPIQVTLFNCVRVPYYGKQEAKVSDPSTSPTSFNPWMFLDYLGTSYLDLNERCPETCNWNKCKGDLEEFQGLPAPCILHYLRCHAIKANCGCIGEMTDYLFLRQWHRMPVSDQLKLFYLPYQQFKEVGLSTDSEEFDDTILIGSDDPQMDADKVKSLLDDMGFPSFGIKEMMLREDWLESSEEVD